MSGTLPTGQPAVPTVGRRRSALRSGGASIASLLLFGFAAIGAMQFAKPTVVRRPLRSLRLRAPEGSAAPNAFGASGQVKLRFALPDEALDFPIEVAGDPSTLAYQWVREGDGIPVESPRPLAGAPIAAPDDPGFYHLALVRDSVREVLREPTLAVMVPFQAKIGNWLNGYNIGTYLAERLGRADGRPVGFLEVTPENADLPVSRHFRLSDFITHDEQGDVWPKYVALNPRLLDKLELVVAKLAAERHVPDLALDVHSGFRTPAHNAEVRRAARDSRHQYGDAADVVIDVNGDGKVTVTDEVLVAKAVEEVEAEHPELVGGLGLYTSRRYRTPYVHIDARGRRSRWRG